MQQPSVNRFQPRGVNPYGALPRPGTGARPGTGFKRVPTAAGLPPPADGPVGLTTQLDVAARPATAVHGLRGAPIKTGGPGRQVADKSYYLTEVRGKIKEITEEIKALQAEKKRLVEGSERYKKLEKTYEAMVAEVRELEGQLADFNLALDKLRTNTDIEEVQEAHERMREQNDNERATIDEIYKKRKAGDRYTQQLEEELESKREAAAEQLREMGGELRDEYARLRGESERQGAQLRQQEERLGRLRQAVQVAEQRLDSDEFQVHKQGLALEKRRDMLREKRAELQEETQLALSPEQMKERLLAKVKQHTEDNKRTEQRIKELRSHLEELEEAKKYAAKKSKYDALFERGRKMQEFIDRFPRQREEDTATMRKLQQTIVAYLENISKGITRSENLPDQARLAELKDELSFKAQKMEQSKETMEMLKKEHVKRRAELDKMNGLDDKITKEIAAFRQKIDKMRADMAAFKDPSELREQSAAATQQLEAANAVARKKREAIKQQVHLLSQAFDQQKRALAESPTVDKLDKLQTKLRTYAQTVFELSDYIESRKRESDYETVLARVRELTDRINQGNIQRSQAK